MPRALNLSEYLAALDATAQSLPRARSWLTYPLFMFARYPHLRPAKDDRRFSQKLQTWEAQITSDPEAKRALEGLAPALREQLAALMVDVMGELESYEKKLSRPPKTFVAEAERRARM